MGTQTWTEKICIWIAFHLPRQLVYWCAIRVMTNTKDNPGSWTCAEAAGAWLGEKNAGSDTRTKEAQVESEIETRTDTGA